MSWKDRMAELCDDSVAPERKTALLSGVTDADITGEMLAACASYLLDRVVKLDIPDALDVCGTGGDKGKGVKTFNISTAAAFVLAGGGVPVVKHGNRAVSSVSGSSDVLEALGVPVAASAEEAKAAHARHNICFAAAPAFHPALKGLAPVRKALGRPTFFNLLGPLCNPARVRMQVIGVFDPAYLRPVAEAARLLGKTSVIVAHSDDGLDELSIASATRLCVLKDGEITEKTVTPESCGVLQASLETLQGGLAADNARIIRAVLGGEKGPPADIVCLNAGAGFFAAGAEDSIRAGVMQARSILSQGLAFKKLTEMAA